MCEIHDPGICGISPSSGVATGGTTVTITGTDLAGVTAVNFAAAPATSFRIVSDTEVLAVAPAGTGTVDVTATSPDGTSPTSAVDRYTYVAPVLGVTGMDIP